MNNDTEVLDDQHDAQQDYMHVPLLQDIVTPGKELFPPLPGTTQADIAAAQEKHKRSVPETSAPPESTTTEIPGLELQPIMEQLMQELRQELDGRISTILGQALEDTLHSTLHRYETQLKQRVMTHLEQRLPGMIQSRPSDPHNQG